jgi:hypothetical protein
VEGDRQMKNYKEWLGLTCTWAIEGLKADDFLRWQDLTTELNKHCLNCEEGYVCESCKNTGLNLTIQETILLKAIEMNLDKNRSTIVN